MSPKYDFIIAGAGLSGLSFINHLLKNNLINGEILILDINDKKDNDRTWSFWSETQPEYQSIKGQSWDQLGFAGDDFVRFESIAPYNYYTIKGIDFYNEIFSKIGRHDKIQFKNDKVLSIKEKDNTCEVTTEHGIYYSDFVIDSISKPNFKAKSHITNYQNFLGWTVKTDFPEFDPKKPILMDFRVPQKSAASFMYILPFSENSALIEFTQFTKKREIDKVYYQKELKNYISKVLKISEYSIIEEEIGTIPMSNFPFDPRPSKRVFRLGTLGGDTKSSTGYTFVNVQNHVNKIVDEIFNGITAKVNNTRFKFYDDLLLKIISEKPESIKGIMEDLFKNQPINRILKFLDEDTNLIEESLIFKKLPWSPFIKALINNRRNVTIP